MTSGRLDLHLHSSVSDGRLTPGELVRLAHRGGVETMALTDHDSTDGLAEAEAAGAELGVRVIPGIELSTDLPGASIHILGLFLEYREPGFQQAVRLFREARLTRAQRMVDALARLGAPIGLERVFEIAGEGSVGRPHVAQALLEAGHVQSIEEAFDRFIGRNGPAYYEGFRMQPADAVRLVHSVGGLAAWAHPNELDGRDWQEYLPRIVEAGVDGLEAYYSKDYGPEVPRLLLQACARFDLAPTVGSDFHGFASMDHPPGSVEAPSDLFGRIEARVARIRCSI
ncbi:MAG: PHP domain-containing protein [Chloroflexota bacterium]|nr:PHP domain-containing protein [Chloroflexota bacterium]